MTLTLAAPRPRGGEQQADRETRVAGFPATTPCSVTGAVAVVNEPIPAPATSTPATIGTFDVSSSPAADAPRELSVTGVVAAAEASAQGRWRTAWNAPAGV